MTLEKALWMICLTLGFILVINWHYLKKIHDLLGSILYAIGKIEEGRK
jgi:hypothetical protein